MLPPPINASKMSDNSKTIYSLATQQEQNSMNQHHPSDIFLNTTKDDALNSASSISETTPTNAATSTPPVPPFHANRIKHFFNKTLANVTETNFTNHKSEYVTTFSNSSLWSSSSNASSSSSPSSSSYAIAADVYDGLINAPTRSDGATGIAEVPNSFDSYVAAADMAVSFTSSLSSNGSHHLETSTTSFPTAQTMATFIAGNKNRATTIIVYPTVPPESIVIPIVSCIFGFPILAFIVICCLRHRAKLARERDRRRNYDMQDHAVGLVRFSPIHRLNYRSSRAISLRPERSLSQGFTSLDLDTVVEERCSDVEQTQTEILNPESPMETSTTSCKMSFSSS